MERLKGRKLPKHRGLYQPVGTKIWWLSLTVKGVRTRMSTGTDDIREALAFRDKKNPRTFKARNPELFDNATTIAELADLTVEYTKANKRAATANGYRNFAARLTGRPDKQGIRAGYGLIGELVADSTTGMQIEAILSKEAAKSGVSNCTFNHWIRFIKRCYSLGVKHDAIETKPHFSEPRPEYARRREITAAEDAVLLRVVRTRFPYALPAYLTARFAGLRQGNLCNLTWDNVNLDSVPATITIDGFKMKNGSDLCIPISTIVADSLRSLPSYADRQGFVFRNALDSEEQLKSNRYWFDKAKKLAGIEKSLHLHDLRHAYGTDLRDKGVSIEDIAELLGHRNIQTTRAHYASPSVRRLATAVESLSLPEVIETGNSVTKKSQSNLVEFATAS